LATIADFHEKLDQRAKLVLVTVAACVGPMVERTPKTTAWLAVRTARPSTRNTGSRKIGTAIIKPTPNRITAWEADIAYHAAVDPIAGQNHRPGVRSIIVGLVAVEDVPLH
jgi:hypothetical protein